MTHPRTASIAIVAPGGYAPDQAALERAIDSLRAQGCRVRNFYDPAARHQRFGATDAERAGQLHAAALDPDVEIILALRGGYGMTRLLPSLDLDLLAGCGKLLVGHSDFTVLQMALLAHSGAITFAGPMVCDDFTRAERSEFTMEHFWQCISNRSHAVRVTAPGNPRIQASGTLWGGNLTMLAHLAGTGYLPPVDGGILFIEDINEHPYRVERMMLQLLHAGVLERQTAILFGDFSSYRLSDYDNGYDFDAMLAYLRSQLAAPVLTGLPFGHIRDKATLAVGCRATVESDGSGFTLTMEGYPFLDRAS